MENSDSIWQWCNARKKNFEGRAVGKIKSKSIADGFCSEVSKEHLFKRRQCMDVSSVRRSPRNYRENSLKSKASCRNACLPVPNSSMEIDPLKNGDFVETNSTKSPISVLQGHVSSSDTNSDTISKWPSSPRSQFLPCFSSIASENGEQTLGFDQRKPTKLKVWRRGQRTGHEPTDVFTDEGHNNSSCRFSACHGETSVEASSSSSISKVAEDMHLQSWSVTREIRQLKPLGGSESSSSYRDWHCHHPVTRSFRRNRDSVSETCKSPCPVGESEIAFEGLHLLADAAVRVLETDQAGFPEYTEGKASSEQWIKKVIFVHTGVPFLQKRVLRRAKSAYKYDRPDVLKMHDGENPSAVIPKVLLTGDAICELDHLGMKNQSENQALHCSADEDQVLKPHVRCSKRTRSQALPSKYCDSVLQPWKRGTRR